MVAAAGLPWAVAMTCSTTIEPVDLLSSVGKRQYVSLQCPVLDGLLGGKGLPCGLITEVAGEAGAGKTQLAVQALVAAQYSRAEGGPQASALYIYTEGEPPLRRLQRVAEAQKQAHGRGPGAACLSRVYLQRDVCDPHGLAACLERAEQHIRTAARSQWPVRLLVLDSIAAVFRDLGDAPGVAELRARSELMFAISARLRRMASQHQLAVLVNNQITDDVGSSGGAQTALTAGAAAPASGAHSGALWSSGRKVLPSLGLAWAHCVHSRLFASKQQALGPGGATRRQLTVAFSPYLPPAHCHYEVCDAGVRGLPADAAEQAEATAAGDHRLPLAAVTGQPRQPSSLLGTLAPAAGQPGSSVAACAATTTAVHTAAGQGPQHLTGNTCGKQV